MQPIEDYLAAWNAETSNQRRHLLAKCMTVDVVYVDPHVADPIHGIGEMQALMERFREKFDHHLQPDGDIDTHHRVFRMRWQLVRENGEMLSKGLMVGDLSVGGIIERVVHFVDASASR